MNLFPCKITVVPFLLYGLLGTITAHTSGSDGMSQMSVKNDENTDNSGIIHILTLSESSTDMDKEVVLDSPAHLKLECILVAESMQISDMTWKHEEEEISTGIYRENNTSGVWRTILDVLVADVNSTGNYSCVFSSKAKATFYVKVPAVHGGGKSLVTYDGDTTVLKCDTHTYKPVEWLWYKVSEDQQVLLNMSSIPSKFKQENKTVNETKLHISGLSEGDSGDYVCKAVFRIGESEGQFHISVLSLMAPFKVFIAILAEVAVFVAIILGYEFISKKKKHPEEDTKSEDEQMAHLKSDENGTSEASSTRQRKA